MKLDSVFNLIKIGVPPLLELIKSLFHRKKYTGEEIQDKAQSELGELAGWREKAKKEREDLGL